MKKNMKQHTSEMSRMSYLQSRKSPQGIISIVSCFRLEILCWILLPGLGIGSCVFVRCALSPCATVIEQSLQRIKIELLACLSVFCPGEVVEEKPGNWGFTSARECNGPKAFL